MTEPTTVRSGWPWEDTQWRYLSTISLEDDRELYAYAPTPEKAERAVLALEALEHAKREPVISQRVENYLRETYDDGVRRCPDLADIGWTQYRRANVRAVLDNVRAGLMTATGSSLRYLTAAERLEKFGPPDFAEIR